MIDWEDIEKEDSEEELSKLKAFLYEENLRIKNEREQLEQDKKGLQLLQDQFIKDRVKLRDEINELNRRTSAERNKLKQENMFFEKKMAILTEGFRSLEEDKRKFEEEKKNFLAASAKSSDVKLDANSVSEYLFRSIGSNPLGLRKRYKDLIKIYHPDNIFGDIELVQAINKEFQKRKEKN